MEPILEVHHPIAEGRDVNIVIEDSCNCNCCCCPLRSICKSPKKESEKTKEVAQKTFFGINFSFQRR